MEVDRLHGVVQTLIQDQADHNVVGAIGQIVSMFIQSVQQPGPETATAFATARTDLETTLDRTTASTFSLAELRIVERLGGGRFAGMGLREKIDSLLEASSPPSETIEALQALNQEAGPFESIPKLVETAVTSSSSGSGGGDAIGTTDPEFSLNRGTKQREVAIAE